MTSALLILLVAVNPVAVAAVLRGLVDRFVLAVALAAAWVVAVLLAVASEPVLDLLSVTAPTFRVAAGAVLGLAAAVWAVRGPRLLSAEAELLADPNADTHADTGRWSAVAMPLLVPVLVTPQLVSVCIAVGADEGVLAVAVGASVALVLAGVASLFYRGPAGLWSVAVRLSGLPGAAVGLGMIVDGVKAV